MPILPMPGAAVEALHEHARRHPERETLELATAGATQVLSPGHGVTKAGLGPTPWCWPAPGPARRAPEARRANRIVDAGRRC